MRFSNLSTCILSITAFGLPYALAAPAILEARTRWGTMTRDEASFIRAMDDYKSLNALPSQVSAAQYQQALDWVRNNYFGTYSAAEVDRIQYNFRQHRTSRPSFPAADEIDQATDVILSP
ncbi:hypothetical protein BJ170DRAFT_693811 [Xylariales sp. AK1849]|nr:hypothetical protein BJ170DRAFT_693811 [Xylariales sp. AK1849]